MKAALFFLSDFGTEDGYLAQMKAAALLEAPPGTAVIDITHTIRPGDIHAGAFHLWVAAENLPAGSVVVAVVDPGVGTERAGVIVETGNSMVVAPDNGLSGLLPVSRAWLLPPPDENSSSTFHGRDIFAPAGGRLLQDPGWPMNLQPMDPGRLVPFSLPLPRRFPEGMEATAAHIDRFGNVILWLFSRQYAGLQPSAAELPCGKTVPVTCTGTYGNEKGLLFLRGSQGCMELSLSGGSAAEEFGMERGMRIRLLTGKPGITEDQ